MPARLSMAYWLRSKFLAASRFFESLPETLLGLKTKRPGSAYVSSPSTSASRATFEPSPFDMNLITIVYDRDDYVRQAVDKYVDLCFKEGFKIVGKDKEALAYVKTRLAYMSALSGRTTSDLLNQIIYNMVKYGNALVAKARLPRNRPYPFRAMPIGKKPPIAYYEPLSPPSMQVALRQNGEVVAYRQQAGNVGPVFFDPDDIVHFYWKRDDGHFWGVPWIWPAIEDVKLLRVLEQNMDALVRKYVFPILHAKIGLPTPGLEAEDEDIEKARQDFESMPPEGIWVTPERYSISKVSMSDATLDIRPYLEYMEQRVFTGLGVSSTSMGRGGTANRSTASTQAKEMHDRVAAIHRQVENIFNQHIINEILMEGGYDPIANGEEIGVALRFNNSDLDAQTKRENSIIYRFEHNVATFEETRRALGEDEDIDISRLKYFMMPGGGSTSEVDNRQQPQNQYGKKPAATDDKQNERKRGRRQTESREERLQVIEELESFWHGLADRVEQIAREEKPYPRDLAAVLAKEVRFTCRLIEQTLSRRIGPLFHAGAAKARQELRQSKQPVASKAQVEAIRHLIASDLDRIAKDISNRIKKHCQESSAKEIPQKVRCAIEASTYRIRFCANTYLSRAYHAGFAYQAKAAGRAEVGVVHDHDACDYCLVHESIDLSEPDLIAILPPFHAGDCRCSLSLPTPAIHTGSPREEVSA